MVILQHFLNEIDYTLFENRHPDLPTWYKHIIRNITTV